MKLFLSICGSVVVACFMLAAIVMMRLHTHGPALVTADPSIPITEIDCPKQYHYARCGVISAPLDYQNPEEAEIQVAFIYHQPALPSIGKKRAVQVLHGGPGGAITEALKAWKFTKKRTRLMIRDRALIGVDPRGVGLSTNFECQVLGERHYNEPGVIETCAKQLGTKRIHISTANTARDFDRVRRALGIDEVDIYAFSYGTNLATVYASIFPEKVRTLALDGAYPIIYPYFHPTFYDAMKRQFRQACERSEACGGDDALNALAWAANELRQNPRPLHFPEKKETKYLELYDHLTPTLLASLALNQASIDRSDQRKPAIWRLPVVGALINARDKGDWGDLEALAVEAVSYKAGEKLNNGSRAQTVGWAIDCPEMTNPWTEQAGLVERRVQLSAAASGLPADRFEPFTVDEWVARPSDLNHYGYCIFWPAPPADRPVEARHELGKLREDLPVLIVNGDYDMATPTEDAIIAATQFEKGQLAKFHNHKHVVLPRSNCAFRLWKEFLYNGQVNNPDLCLDADPMAISISASKN